MLFFSSEDTGLKLLSDNIFLFTQDHSLEVHLPGFSFL